ncbi:hypothetical protein ACFX1Q_046451 [Malus domestica]
MSSEPLDSLFLSGSSNSSSAYFQGTISLSLCILKTAKNDWLVAQRAVAENQESNSMPGHVLERLLETESSNKFKRLLEWLP